MIADQAKHLLSETRSDVIAQKDVGYIKAGETIPQYTNLQELVEKLLFTTFYPTFAEPTSSLDAGITLSQEAGENLNFTLTAGYTAGKVFGANVNNVWSPAPTLQSSAWTGAANTYTFSGPGTSDQTGTSATCAVSTQLVNAGLAYTVTVGYDAGDYVAENSKAAGNPDINKDANGNTYQKHSSGTVPLARVNFTAYRNLFYGVSSSSVAVPTNNASAASIVRDLSNTKSAAPHNGTTFTITVPVGAKRVLFAYPGTLNPVTRVIDSGTGYDVKGAFTKVEYTVPGANDYDPVNYKIYYFVPPSPFEKALTYTVTI